MRQLWTRASRPRFFLVVAAMSVITLGASSPIYSAVRGSHVTGHTSPLRVAKSGAMAATANCSKAAALQVATPLKLVTNPDLPDPIAQVLCGPFLGPGSQAMVVSFAQATCWGINGWAIFSFTGSAWQLVPNESHKNFIFPLAAVGSDIRERVPVYRKGDGPCTPSGGSKARIWHWDGMRFVAGAWKQVTSGKAPQKDAIVFSPLRYGVTCHMTDDGSFRGSWVYCWIGGNPHPTRHVKLNPDGRFSATATTPIPQGLGGPVPPYGTRVTAGRFRCQSLRSGMKCTVISTGKGFLFSIQGARRVGP